MVTAQVGGFLFAMLLLVAVPPVQGKMLLVPIDGAAAGRMVTLAIAHDARLVGRGPLPFSMVVYGQRAALAAPLLKAGILILAAPAAGCGASAGGVA